MKRHPHCIGQSILLVIVAAVVMLMSSAHGEVKKPVKRLDLTGASWIWRQKHSSDGEIVYFRKAFELSRNVIDARLVASCDNGLVVFVNGKKVAHGDQWKKPVSARVTRHVRTGSNVVAVRGANVKGIAGLVLRLRVTVEGGRTITVVTDDSWRCSPQMATGWRLPGFDATSWKAPYVHSKYPAGSWGELPRGGDGGGGRALAAESLRLLEGFHAELLYSVPKAEQGSWVSLTVDTRGRLIASDQSGALYRITPPPIGGESGQTDVQRLDVEIGSAHGLLHAFGSLYVVVNGKSHGRGSGLYRVRDTDGDDEFDEIVLLRKFRGAGEHGPHAAVLGPDGKSIYVVGGNHTDPPKPFTSSRVPMNWGEDLLLPRQWDANGHARGKLAPGGWVLKTDPDGKTWELVSIGYRNGYDAAFNLDGELFCYDADMEWDLGAPWYRPTRVCHAISGSDFGWRSGTGKWPEYYADSLPAVIDIGPGSPTGVVSGTGTKFPAKYQAAIYCLDWTFGTMHVVHLRPDGASYTAVKEEFVSGTPLPLTDAVIGLDGAMYFTIGGRGTQSGLYRVTYVGNESTVARTAASADEASRARALRRRLEAFHGRTAAAAIDAAWPHLRHADRFIRYAARLAIEHQDIELWKERALRETDPVTAITAIIALARQGSDALRSSALATLDRVPYERLARFDRLALLRAYALVFVRMGKPDVDSMRRVARRLEPYFPAGDDMLNREFSRVLVFLNSPVVITRTLELMKQAVPEGAPDIQALLDRNQGYGKTIAAMFENQPVRQKIHYALVLRNMRFGWTLEQRAAYFKWFNDAVKAKGGASFQGFLQNIKKEALANCADAERHALASITGESLAPPTVATERFEPKGPGREWAMDDILPLVNRGLRRRVFANGRKMFSAARCGTCHRFDGVGGSVGPDLTSVVSRFSYRDLLENTLTPSKVVSDQYGSTIIMKKDGGVVVGRVVGETDGKLSVVVDPYDPGKVTVVKRSVVSSTTPAPVSLMPEGLLNALNREEVLDLLAYIMSRGDSGDSVFR